MNSLKIRQRLLEQIMRLKDKEKEEGLDEQKKELCHMLAGVGKEALECFDEGNKALAIENEQIEAKELVGLLAELIEAFSEALEALMEQLSGRINMKFVFEQFDELVGGLEDWIEDFNEWGEEKGKNLSYLEAWDISFFF